MFIIFTVCSGFTLNLDKKQNLTYLVVLRRNCQYHRKSRSLLSNFKERQQNLFFQMKSYVECQCLTQIKVKKLQMKQEGCVDPIFAHSSTSSLGILLDIIPQIPKYSRLFCTLRITYLRQEKIRNKLYMEKYINSLSMALKRDNI